MDCFLAIDIGASSGRHIVGYMENGRQMTREVFRFPNGVKSENGRLVWDTERLFASILDGLKAAFREYPDIASLSIDTWGVDYVLLRGDSELLPCHAYRDARTDKAVFHVHEKIPFETLYEHTGSQFQPFNSIYQLQDDLERGRLEDVTDLLMMPEYFMYRLTGVKAREYTNATTTGMVNAKTGEFDRDIIDALGFPRCLFPKLSRPGAVLGKLKPEIAEAVGGNCDVVLCATHDTASAVEGIGMEENAPYISSGTWSLLGVKTPAPLTDKGSLAANYSNEGGVGYNRYQKNIMGMWLINCLQKELCPDTPFPEIVKMAEESAFDALVDANAPDFLSPKSMKAAFDAAIGKELSSPGDYFRCAYRSLAVSYRAALDELEKNTGIHYNMLYIVGGGAKNQFLNHLTEAATEKKVIALPLEATALGNLKIQMERTL